MKRLRVSYGLGLAIALLVPSFLAQHFAVAADLNGFAIRTLDKSVTVTLFSEQPVSYTTERQDRQLTIILSDAKLSKKLVDEGLPVVIDDQNRFIGRAVPSSDGKVKIILPNLPAEGYSVSIRQQHGAASSPVAASTTHALIGPEAPKSAASNSFPIRPSTNTLLKPRSAVKTNSKQAFDQMLAKLPVATRNHPTMAIDYAHNNGANPPQIIKDRLNSPSPMMLTTVEPDADNGGKHPGTIWNPYVVKINPAPKGVELSNSGNNDADSSMRLYSGGNFTPVQHYQTDPYARLHAIANNPTYTLPTPPSFIMPNVMPANFHASPPVLPPPIVAPDDSKVEPDAATDKSAAATPAKKAKAAKTIQVTTQTTNGSIGATVRRLLESKHVNWLWVALGLFMSGIGLFCLLGSALLGRILLMRNLSFSRPAEPAPVVAPAPVVEAPQSPKSFNQRRPMRPGLGFQDVAVVNALDYTHRSTSTMSDAIKHNPFRERVAARAQVKPQPKSPRQPTMSR